MLKSVAYNKNEMIESIIMSRSTCRDLPRDLSTSRNFTVNNLKRLD
jgi:hypothetical protein